LEPCEAPRADACQALSRDGPLPRLLVQLGLKVPLNWPSNQLSKVAKSMTGK
jgi:hypothetical protein